jgi:hypothetical protein
MVALTERKIEIVRTLVEAAPDRVVGGLQAALAETPPESALAGVRRLVEAEASERVVRNTVLQPLAPMCRGDGRAPDAMTFPARVLPLVWRGLMALRPAEVDVARLAWRDLIADDPIPDVFDDLVRAAADAVEARQPAEFAQAVALCEAVRPNGAELLVACLRLAPIVRSASQRLAQWLSHFDDASAAAARLAYNDAVDICPDGGPLFFEMLAAQMPQSWKVLRVISEVMDKPTERYLADSEMAFFGERVMAEVDESLRAIAKLDLDGGPPAAREAGRLVELITLQVNEVETCVDLSRDHGWGQRIGKQRHGLANVVEGRLKDAEKHAKEALPTQLAKIGGVRRNVPRLVAPPDPRKVARAVTLLAFAHEVRSSINYGGFAAARARMVEQLSQFIDHYVEEVLDRLKVGDAENEANAYAFLEVAAQFNLLVQGEKAAELVRRRAIAIAHPEPPQAARG